MGSFQRFAGYSAVVAGIGGPLYSIAFVVLVVLGINPGLGLPMSALLLALGAILTTAVLVALYQRTVDTESGFALWALLLGLAGSAGSVAHGVFDLANIVHPVAGLPSALVDLPSQVDPRGLATFGLTGMALLLYAWLMSRGDEFPKALANLGYLAGALYLALFLGRLIILAPTHPVVAGVAAVSGLIVTPAWYIWLGRVLLGAKVKRSARRPRGR